METWFKSNKRDLIKSVKVIYVQLHLWNNCTGSLLATNSSREKNKNDNRIPMEEHIRCDAYNIYAMFISYMHLIRKSSLSILPLIVHWTFTKQHLKLSCVHSEKLSWWSSSSMSTEQDDRIRPEHGYPAVHPDDKAPKGGFRRKWRNVLIIWPARNGSRMD